MTKKTVLVMFGGRSPEHDISVITGLQIIQALDPTLYTPIPLYISPSGRWWTGKALLDRANYIPNESSPPRELFAAHLTLGDGKPATLRISCPGLFARTKTLAIDVAFPCFHGLVGEDGRIQGLLEVADLPYAGMRSLAGHILMNKSTTKHMMAGSRVPMLPHIAIPRPQEGWLITADELKAQLGDVSFPACIKPANLGSSIGVAKVHNFDELSMTLPGIFKYDDLALLEPFVENLVEYNVAVRRLPNGTIVTSAIERPKHTSDLLDFKAKYLSGGGSKKLGGTKSPASSEGMLSLTRDINPDIPPDMEEKLRSWAKDVYARVDGTGAPRLDFLCNSATGDLWFNEANPLPGSLAYFLWEASKDTPILFSTLLDELIHEAITLHTQHRLPPDPTPEAARLLKRQG